MDHDMYLAVRKHNPELLGLRRSGGSLDPLFDHPGCKAFGLAPGRSFFNLELVHQYDRYVTETI